MHFLLKGFDATGFMISSLPITAASATAEMIQKDALTMLADAGHHDCVTATAEPACPKCKGVPEDDTEDGCEGCMACDFHGTLAGYEGMQALERELKAPPCTECGAMTANEAETKCNCSGDKDNCHGCTLWPD